MNLLHFFNNKIIGFINMIQKVLLFFIYGQKEEIEGNLILKITPKNESIILLVKNYVRS